MPLKLGTAHDGRNRLSMNSDFQAHHYRNESTFRPHSLLWHIDLCASRPTSVRLSRPVPKGFPQISLSGWPGLPLDTKEIGVSTGTVKWFSAQKGFGFIQPDDGSKDVFVHISAVERSGMDNLREGQKLRYEVEQDRQGRASATNLNAGAGNDNATGTMNGG
jgi:cold shock protein